MAEYIEREVTCEDCIHYAICIFHHHGDENKKCVHFKNKANVVEVRHGEWLLTKEPLGWQDVDCVECSACRDSWVCGEDFDFDYCKDYWQYCPNCGAKMDGKGEGE